MFWQTGRSRAGRAVFFLAVYILLLLFFAVLHPIPIMDEDDVIYSVLSRPAIPIPGFWNPSRMLPELLMPLCGNLAAICARIGFGSFVDCQVFLLGALLSAFITAYVYAFRRLLEKRFDLDSFSSGCLSILFLLLHFLIFRTDYSRNLHMFSSYDACCICYYTIPALLCCTLVMVFMAEPEDAVRIPEGLFHASVMILALYCAVFSNLFGSVILAAYAGCRFLRNLFKRKPWKNKAAGFWKDNAVLIGIVLFWLAAAVLEATGGRAGGAVSAAAEGRVSLLSSLRMAVGSFCQRLLETNLLFRLILAACVVCGTAACVIRADSKENRRFLNACGGICVWGGISTAFILILSAAASPGYAGRPQVIFPIIFCVFLLMLLAICQILKRIPVAACLLPIVLVFTCTMINTRFLTFADSNPLFIDGRLAVKIENDIYGKVIEAAEAGETEVTVQVPKSWDLTANWPHNANIGNPIAEFFLKYGLIDHEITVYTEPSEEYNEAFGIHPDLSRIVP